ncbi:MAG: AAA family ATPase [Deltaproteobacteria bacterium]|nr:AAA family ATPase [Deltaproteobacteria bacterium]
MGALIDREKEREALRARLAQDSSLCLVYGPRRTGKTFLLQHLLASQKRAIYFLADETTSAAQLRRFHAQVAASGLGGRAWGALKQDDWGSLLDVLIQAEADATRPLLLVLDEVQYLLAQEPSLPSILQRIVDAHRKKARLHLILCGSALGTLAALGDAGQPLHGRLDLRLKIGPFAYAQAARFAPRWPLAERLRLYGVFGGVARHLAEIRAGEDLAANACRAILAPLGPLHEAPLDMLRAERLSSRAEAEAVLSSIALGENRFNAIAARANLPSSRLDYVLKELQALEIIEREVRLGDRPGARTARYRCRDPFVTFWFRLLLPNRSALQGTAPEIIWKERIAGRIDGHMGPVFERIAAQALRDGLLQEKLGPLDELGSWWSRDGKTQIDLVARYGDRLLLAECKWRAGSAMPAEALGQLKDHASRYPIPKGIREVCFALASAGRLPRPRKGADAPILIGLKDLLP